MQNQLYIKKKCHFTDPQLTAAVPQKEKQFDVPLYCISLPVPTVIDA